MHIADSVTEFRRDGLALIVQDVAEYHPGALGHHCAHVRGAHPPSTATDECDLARQPFCHFDSPVVSVLAPYICVLVYDQGLVAGGADRPPSRSLRREIPVCRRHSRRTRRG